MLKFKLKNPVDQVDRDEQEVELFLRTSRSGAVVLEAEINCDRRSPIFIVRTDGSFQRVAGVPSSLGFKTDSLGQVLVQDDSFMCRPVVGKV